jgi:hypothetical protein
VHDAVIFERRGIPAVVLVTEPFLPMARGQAKILGMPDVRIVAVQHPLAHVDEAGIRARGAAVARAVAAALAVRPGDAVIGE